MAADRAELEAPGIATMPLYNSAVMGSVAAAVALATPLNVTQQQPGLLNTKVGVPAAWVTVQPVFISSIVKTRLSSTATVWGDAV